jgi:iron complex transport system substrate-binding protein
MLRYGFPRRIVCLTEETTEVLYALGAQDLIVGISGFTVRPPEARKQKVKVSTYLDANIDKIADLKPDLILAWSDLQADICSRLIKQGMDVHCFNHRSVQGILHMIIQLGSMIGMQEKAIEYADSLQYQLDAVQSHALQREKKPLVYFEEWFDPLITGICWVSELIELCGGIDVFAENRHFPDARRRILADMNMVIQKNPDIMIASWCGKGFRREKVLARPGWQNIPFVQNNQMHEIKSAIILQPGPAALTDGAKQISAIFDAWALL